MSSEQISSTSDLRSRAQDTKRDAAHKHKWGMGAMERVGRGEGNPRPVRPSDCDYTAFRRADKGVDALESRAKMTRKHDMLEGTSAAAISDDSSGSNSDFDDNTPAPPVDNGVMYSFDAIRSPSQGSQILNAALAKAVEKYEERETVKLVKSEYDVLDAAGETVISPVKKKEGKARKPPTGTMRVPDADEDYEFL